MFCKHLDEPLIFVQNITGDEANMAKGKRSIWKCPKCGKIIYRSKPFDQDKVSDGFHTFEELYDHRAILFSVICNLFSSRAWKSKFHYDGTMYPGYFIVGIDTPEGQASYHYRIDPYWDYFNVKEVEKAPPWDGYTSKESVDRIGNMCKVFPDSAIAYAEELNRVVEILHNLATKNGVCDGCRFNKEDGCSDPERREVCGLEADMWKY